MRQYWEENKDLILYSSISLLLVHFLTICTAFALSANESNFLNIFFVGFVSGILAMFSVINLADHSFTELIDKLGVVAYFLSLGGFIYVVMSGASIAIVAISSLLLGWLANWFFSRVSLDMRIVV